ncbi:hypothetical protein DPMN_129826 [Dreissena polymorpha]|uniref:Uncharacterized protein n=1 Tax=Dreissena polymorpha TaxID=45954 RepID=A0A9D4H9T2_DREPO|nr:hypothetical protein DPMN_129826 [Dreissena polymorpha]
MKSSGWLAQKVEGLTSISRMAGSILCLTTSVVVGLVVKSFPWRSWTYLWFKFGSCQLLILPLLMIQVWQLSVTDPALLMIQVWQLSVTDPALLMIQVWQLSVTDPAPTYDSSLAVVSYRSCPYL